ncbi:Glyoxalase superfamily enzyme, possibly 3-demethylubiquinone-9 3-methyltransferase [Pedobacter westerhofensis]|uniref:Glyoxalase superfamily enzyme, possibly 3-demethylubiquinone-9 3-methyltransferase n=1 Tax=Pedobacter westerhofensis TaxID=425512 RepID=A0A521BFF1_9SPHI|nr:VOC family protein [Pedobacter westerhofensis]SMO45799.1 Glyoxalase superfamily enzyme, possibly 3-demethylubiquinone-9 3-methyltransferase [Pedobacter westerhofensis]
METTYNNTIYPCLILKDKVSAAADFYIHAFGNGKVLQTNPIVTFIELSGQNFMLLNDGTSARPNASISFMVTSETPEETAQYWNNLAEGGKVLMPLDSYDWSIKYGWVEDKFGVSWQLFTGSKNPLSQKFCPSLMFTGADAGKAREAVHFYTQLFPKSGIEGMMEYSGDDGDTAGFIKHAQFQINGLITTAMDSSADHGFKFNEVVSLVVNCDTQDEIDHYWDNLTSDGGQEVMCGWLKDKYGISWQIVPKVIGELVTDPERGPRVMQAVMKMKKLIIEDLINA